MCVCVQLIFSRIDHAQLPITYLSKDIKYYFTKEEDDDGSEVRYPIDEKSAWSRSQLDSFRVASRTEVLWYNETVSPWRTMYIYM